MVERQRRWSGRVVGALAGVVIAGGAAAMPEYVDSPWVGVPVAAGGALLGFASGLGWDRRQERLARAERWAEVFTAGPAPGPGGAGSGESVLSWLAPWEAVVPFATRRYRDVGAIRRWCVEHQRGRVWLLEGGAGSGKTRLAMQVSQALRTQQTGPWAVGWVRAGHRREAIEVAAGWDQPVLVVVDDADVRDDDTDGRDDLAALLVAAHRPGGRQTVRVLLVAREFSDWWTDVQQPLPAAVEIAGRTRLGTIGADVPSQRVAAKHALAAFADHLGTDPVGIELVGIAAGTPLILLQAAALEAVLCAGEGEVGPVEVSDAVNRLMVREQQRWLDHASEQGLDAYPEVRVDTLRDLLAFTMLTGARTRADAHQLLPLLPGLRHSTPELVDRLCTWLHLYPRVIGFWARPQLPATLAEHLIADALTDNIDLAAAVCLAADTPEHATAVVTVLARAATHTTTAHTATITLLRADPARLLPIAIRVALAGHGPIDAATATCIDHTDPDWQTAQTLEQLLPDYRNVLNRTQIAIAHGRAAHAPTPTDKAGALTTLADALLLASRFGEAVTAATEAVTVWRELAAADPTAHQPYLAHALTGLARTLDRAGRVGEAVTAATESVTIRRELAAADPTAHQPYLAHALASLARTLDRAGRVGEAVTAATESVTIRRELAAADPTAHQPDLAHALASLARTLDRAGRVGEAVTAATESVTIRRELAAADPTAHQPYLAVALTTLANALNTADRVKEAVTAATEAVTVWRELAAADPTAHQPYLAHALASLARTLDRAGRVRVAVTAATESVTVWRELAAADPTAHQPYLAHALTSLARTLDRAGRVGEAVTAATESVTIRRELIAADPTAHQPYLADALISLANALNRAGRVEEAVTAATESVTVRRELAAADATAHQLYLAGGLTILAKALRSAGRFGEAVPAAAEGIALYRQLGITSVNIGICERVIRDCGSGDTT
ncbi:tetratricopeptide repeat protein [Plantactinospora sp. CA-294935]|uniref:tetratricopeptide repeat protein n=1 Tax=Plantactinospora sp. CA-294935 TaxID=3240012 RepID=UPI003D8C5EC7